MRIFETNEVIAGLFNDDWRRYQVIEDVMNIVVMTSAAFSDISHAQMLKSSNCYKKVLFEMHGGNRLPR